MLRSPTGVPSAQDKFFAALEDAVARRDSRRLHILRSATPHSACLDLASYLVRISRMDDGTLVAEGVSIGLVQRAEHLNAAIENAAEISEATKSLAPLALRTQELAARISEKHSIRDESVSTSLEMLALEAVYILSDSG